MLAVYARSPVWSLDYRKAIAAFIPKLDYRSVAGVSHFLMLERPDAINQLVLRFMRAQGLAEP